MVSVIFSFLFVSIITYSATTIGSNIDTTGTLTVSGNTTLGDDSTDLIKSIGSFYASSTLQTTGAARFYGATRIDGATTLNGVSYTWPSSDGSSSQYLQTNGAGILSWSTASGQNTNDWLKQTNYGVLNLTASTTIPYWAKDAIYASSTLLVQGLSTLANATTTQLSIAGNLWINGFATTTSSGNINGQGILTMLGTGTSTFSGGIQGTALNITSATASSTFANGIILSNGCFLMPDGTCAGAGGGSGTINSGTTGQFPYYAGNGTTLTATSSIFLSTNQNVGIGTTTPNWLLQVAGTRPFLALSDTGAGANNKHWFMSSQGGNFYLGTTTDAYATTSISALTITNSGNIGIATSSPATGLLSIENVGSGYTFYATDSANDSTPFVIDASGNVGVGTASPGAPLEVNTGNVGAAVDIGNFRMRNNSAGGSQNLDWYFGSSNRAKVGWSEGSAVFDISVLYQGSPGDIRFFTNNGSERMHITRLGNIGISTTSPWGLLSVNPNGISGPEFVIGSSTATHFIVNTDGKIGIGTTSPTEQLSVSGRLFVGGTGTSTIQNNLYVMGTLRSAVSYVGDLIFSNNFRFIETPPNAKIQSLFLENQNGENLFKIDENGKLIVEEIEAQNINSQNIKSKQGNFEEGNFKKLCLDDICISKTDLKELLELKKKK